jgi:type II secretory pathway pseudopilin PulG
MEPLIVLVLVGGALAIVAAVASSRRNRRDREAADAEQLAAVRKASDEDVTVFGEELQQLGHDMAGRELDAGARADYQRALDAYEDAKGSSRTAAMPWHASRPGSTASHSRSGGRRASSTRSTGRR